MINCCPRGGDRLKLHILRCGYIRVARDVPYGSRSGVSAAARQMLAADRDRVTLPVCAYLVEHPKGLLLVDTGWCRDLSPAGVYDAKAVSRLLPPHLAAFYRPWLPEGMAVHEQLERRGIRPADLEAVLLTHLDPDHVAGLRHVAGAKHIILPEDEYFWSCRTVYKTRQPVSLWQDQPIERRFYRGSPLGPNRWAIDLFGDETVQMVNVPGHTDGQAAILLRSGSGKFILLAADAAFSPRNWRDLVPPGFGFGREWQRKSLQWIAGLAEDPTCAAVLCSHDPGFEPQTMEF